MKLLAPITVLAALVVAVVSGSATAGTRAHAAVRSCGSVAAGGTTWQVSASSVVPCAGARSIVRKLGAKPTPPRTNPYYSGLFSGMRCLGAHVNGKRLIDCGGTGGRAVAAEAK
jgi:hypothetical protein